MIEIVPHKPEWSKEFASLAAKIRAAVGDKAVAIHHIGSTSVPRLDAKDIVDIQMTVADLDIEIQKDLEKIGFELSPHRRDHCPPGLELASSELEKRHYRGAPRRVHLHIRRQGAFNQRYPILFRDFLRATPMAADAYGEIKRQLAKYFPENVDAYYDIKDPVCDALMAGAFEWAKVREWTPGPSEA